MAAGVSITSVSHTLSGSRYVTPETAEKVWKAVKQLGYRPSHSARGLRSGRTYNIGLVIPDMGNLFYTSLAQAIHSLALAAGYQVLMRNTNDSLSQEVSAVQRLFAEKLVDGVIVAPTHGSHAYLQELMARGAKVVVVNRRLGDVLVPSVTGDNEEASYALAKHLLDLGHHRLAIVGHPAGISTGDDRVAGFRRALEERALSADLIWRHLPELKRDPRCEAYAATCSLLGSADPPSAIVATSHQYAEGVLMALRDRGVACPEEVAVAAFGSAWAAQVLSPVLTVAQQNIEAIANHSTDLLFNWLDGKEVQFAPILTKTQLVIGDSCGWRRKAGITAHAYCRQWCLEAQANCPEWEACAVRAGCSGCSARPAAGD